MNFYSIKFCVFGILLLVSCISETKKNLNYLLEENQDYKIEKYEELEDDLLSSDSITINRYGMIDGLNCKKYMKSKIEAFDCPDERNKVTFRIFRESINYCNEIKLLPKSCIQSLIDLLKNENHISDLDDEVRIKFLDFRGKQLGTFSFIDGKNFIINKGKVVLLLLASEDRTIHSASTIKMYDESGQLFVLWLMERKEGLDTYEIAKKLRTEVGRIP